MFCFGVAKGTIIDMLIKLLVVIFIFLPGLALAQDASFLGGPQSNSASSAVSTQTLNILQPANPQSLQSADSGEGGISQPTNQQTLQQTQGGDEVRILLEGEGDGAGKQSEPEDEESPPPYWVLGVPALIALVLWLRKQSQQQT
jgi:hypothetical protein